MKTKRILLLVVFVVTSLIWGCATVKKRTSLPPCCPGPGISDELGVEYKVIES